MTGTVWLVGAGPGDPGLLTVRGRDLLGRAEVVVADRLAAAELLAHAPPGAEVVHVGKSPGTNTLTQDEVNALLVERALAGRTVVRLKGGDPFVLGRGGEEAEACAAAGVPCFVVPGVTSALAAPAYAGIPVTHRGLAQDVAVVSGHLSPGDPASTVDWASLGASSATVVVLMGVGRLAAICAALVAGGRPEATPAALVERATTPYQRVVRSTLAALAVDVEAAGLRSPSVLVVGQVAARSDAVPPLPAPGPEAEVGRADGAGVALAARGGRGGAGPLAGRRVLVPRTRARPGLLARRLAELGGEPVETVVSRLAPPADPGPLLAALPGADALVLEGGDEVRAVVTLLKRAGRDVRALAGLLLVAVDDAAAAALDALGLDVARPSADLPGRVVLPRHRISVAVAGSAATPVGATTRRRVTLLEDVLAGVDGPVAEQLRHGDLDAVALASSTAARATAALYGPLPPGLFVAAVGGRTAEACRVAGIRVDAVATEPGIYPLADAVASLLT